MSTVLIIQTCDGVIYTPFVDLAQEANQKYAEKYGYDYLRYDGVKMPFNKDPSLATFNRIYLLLDALRANKYDWALYLDADAVVYNFDINLDDIISNNDKAICACRGMTDDPNNYWDINIGVCFYNLRHPKMTYILETWKNMFEYYGKSIPNTIDDWEHFQQKLDDQTMLQSILKCDKTLCKVFYGEENSKFNYDGPFIKQIIRGSRSTFTSRLNKMKELCSIIKAKW